MKSQLRNISALVFKPVTVLSVALSMFVLMSATRASASLTFGVTFGTAQENNGPCVGKGVCKESLNDMDATTLIYAGNPEAVSVTFQISPEDSNVLMMSFLMSELQSKQPDQVNYFTNNGSYSFDLPANFVFPNTSTNYLTFPANAVISSSSPSTIAISGNIVTVYVTLVATASSSGGGGNSNGGGN